MNTRTHFLLLACMAAIVLPPVYSQDMFPVRQLSSSPDREGFPTWSPDGKTILYMYVEYVEGQLIAGSRKIPSDGGTPVEFTDFPTEHPKWSPDGRMIVFDADTGAAIRMIPAEGGTPIDFLPDSIHIYRGGLPCWSPSGSHIAFEEGTTGALYVYDVRKGTVSRIFHREGLVALPGCWSRDGKSVLVALMDRETRKCTMWKVSSDGREKEQITGHHENFYRYLVLSPDGTLLVYAAAEGRRLGLWIMPAEGGPSLPLSVSDQYHTECPEWSPDGTQLAFGSGRTGRGDIYIMEMDIGKIRAELNAITR